jgi:hypothetical protein
MSDVFSLKAYRFHIRKPTARVDSAAGSVELYLPAYFGRHRWRLEASGLAVVDLATVGDGSIGSGTVFATPPLVPYFFTTGPGTTPTTGLLFVHPQRVPPIRPLAAWAPNTDVPIGVLESRSKTGADIDGLLLRFDDPAGVAQALLRAGAQSTTDPDRWLEGHRQIVSDPNEARTTQLRHRRLDWLQQSTYLFVALAVLVGTLAGDDPSWLEFTVIMTAVGASFAVRSLAHALMKRSRRRSQS